MQEINISLWTEDKKQKTKDYQKQYRENMTDEQKQKIKRISKKVL